MANGLASGNLAERGITGETVQKYGIEIDSNPTSECFHNRLGFDALREGKLADLVREAIWFPCRNADWKIVARIILFILGVLALEKSMSG